MCRTVDHSPGDRRIYSRNHLVISAAASVVLGLALAGVTLRAVLFVAVGVAVGVGIDLDHFLLERLNTGGWDALRRCLADPRVALFDQQRVFDPGTVGAHLRLLSHLVLGGALAVGTAVLDPELALVVAVVLYLHVLADVYADNRTRGNLPWQAGPPEAVPESDASGGPR